MKMRTIDQCAAYVKSIDPGEIPSVRSGRKYLIALENLDKYFEGRIS